jgi:hypothetical protein
MNYDAITIDTQTVETNGFDFDGGLLAQLKQFVNGPVTVVISQIVASEILRHLREKTQAAKDAVESAHRKALLYGLKPQGETAFPDAPDVPSLAKKRLFKYFQEMGASVISSDDVPMSDLVKLYVQASPPFASSGKKKNEFPDAIALLALEHWAKTNNKKILAVSNDKDWQSFAEKSERIEVTAELSDALEKLQQDADKAAAIVQTLLAAMYVGNETHLIEQFDERLRDEVSSADVYAEANSAYAFEGEEVDLALQRYEFVCDDGEFQARIVQVGPEIIVARVDVHLVVHAEATFSLAVYDSIDKDYVGMGTTTVSSEEEEYDAEVLITFEGDFETNEIAVTKVELIEGLKTIDFGYIEPDFGEPDYDDLNELSQEDQVGGSP